MDFKLAIGVQTIRPAAVNKFIAPPKEIVTQDGRFLATQDGKDLITQQS